MRGISLRKKRQALYGWIKWVPVVVAPFAILLGDTWLNICMWRNDYAYRQLDRQLQAVQAQLAKVAADTADMQDLHSLTEHATELAMVEPSPDQIKTLQGVLPPMVEPEELPQQTVLEIASLEQGEGQIQELVEQVTQTDLAGVVSEHIAPQIAAVTQMAEPLPHWIREEVTPALATAQQLGAPMKDALVETAAGLRETLSTLAPAAAERMGSMLDSAAHSRTMEPLEQLATMSNATPLSEPRPADAPAKAPLDNDPNSLLESL